MTHENVVDLTPSVQREVALVARHGAHPDVKEAMLAVLDDPTMFSMQMTAQDEQRLLGALWSCVPVSATKAAPVDVTVGFVDAVTDGLQPVPDAFAKVEAAWRGGACVVLAPEWLFVGDGAPLTKAGHDDLLQKLCALTAGSDRLCVPGTIAWADDRGRLHNTAYAISNGEVVYRTDKRGDGGDVDIARHHALVYFSRDVEHTTFAWRGLTVGLEICRDHGDARLRRALAERGQPDTVDLQLVVSSGVWVKHAAIGVGGVVALAQGDGTLQHEHYRRADSGRLEPCAP